MKEFRGENTKTRPNRRLVRVIIFSLVLTILPVYILSACARTNINIINASAPDIIGTNSSPVNYGGDTTSPTQPPEESLTVPLKQNGDTTSPTRQSGDNPATPSRLNSGEEWSIRVVGPDGTVARRFTESELADVLSGIDIISDTNATYDIDASAPDINGRFSHVYSTVNNWPAARFYAADGYSVASVLAEAGLYDRAQTILFRSEDDYEVGLTREQLFSPQFYFPNVNIDAEGAEPVYPIIAWRWREGSDDLGDARADGGACLIIGQQNPFEQTNPAFVEKLSEIVVSEDPCEAWPPPTTFPAPGPIAAGDADKLQHPSIGLVKLYYTINGDDPTMLSDLYNPSTFRLELNVPIEITGPTTIKAFARGYGKADSEIAVFKFELTE